MPTHAGTGGAMQLYHVTLLPPAGGHVLAYGAFSGARAQEVALACGSTLHLFRLTRAGTLACVSRTDAFAALRALCAFRLPGSRRDMLVAASDSGALALLTYDARARGFVPAACEAFGRSGVRRAVPGEMLAVDPKGRAVMVGAVERAKFAYIVTRGEEGVQVQSPLEAHRGGVATFAMVALDVDFSNPVFAAVERAYADGKKVLVCYELDLGLNHVVRRCAVHVDDSAWVLLAVPSGGDGPGGLLVCSEGVVEYVHPLEEDDEDGGRARLRARLPRRRAGPDPMVVSGAIHAHKGVFFFVLCTEHGDLLKAELDWADGRGALQLRVMYFDTLRAPAHALAIFRSGYLFAALEAGDPVFLRFDATSVAEGDAGFGCSEDEGDARLEYTPREKLRYFTVVEVVECFAPAIAMAAGDFCGEGATQVVVAGGSGRQSTLRVLRRGFAVLESITHVMPSTIAGLFTLREGAGSAFERYMVVAFADASKVLRVSGDLVAEAYDTGLVSDARTLAAEQVGGASFLQVYPGGVRIVWNGEAGSVGEWKPRAAAVRVLAAAVNGAQVVVALSSGDVAYFEVAEWREGADIQPLEVLTGAVSAASALPLDAYGAVSSPPALAIPDVPSGSVRAGYFAVSDGQSALVRLYQVGGGGRDVKSVGVHMAPAAVESLALVDFGGLFGDALASAAALSSAGRKKAADGKDAADAAADDAQVPAMLSLVIGTRKGAMVTLRVDAATGALSDKRSHFVGAGGVRAQRLSMAGVPCCVAMSARAWLLHRQCGRVAASPLCTESMDAVAPFSSEQYPDGFVAASGSTLRLLSLESLPALSASAALPAHLPPARIPADTALGSYFMSKSPLSATPRRIAPLHDPAAPRARRDGLFVVLEAQHRARFVHAAGPPRTRTLVDAPPGSWASLIRLVTIKGVEDDADPDDNADDDELYAPACRTLHVVDLPPHARAVCVATSTHLAHDDTPHVVVGVALHTTVHATRPPTPPLDTPSPHGELRAYRFHPPTRTLHHLHTTPLPAPPSALSPFRDTIAAGVGRDVRLYALGKKQLLRKAEARHAAPTAVAALAPAGGDRLFLADARSSVTLLTYTPGRSDAPGRLTPTASDDTPRHVVALAALDYATAAASDKHGNVALLRACGARALAPLAHFHVGSVVPALARADGPLLYATVGGGIGAFVPLRSGGDARLAEGVEAAMRDAAGGGLVGRRHVAYRASFAPVRGVVDGDFCERFYGGGVEVGRERAEVERKLTEWRAAAGV